MPRGIKSVVSKTDNKEKKQSNSNNSSTTRSGKKRKNVDEESTSAMATAKQTKSRVRRKLQDAIELDREINQSVQQPNDESGQATKLMYAILPGNSKVIEKIKNKNIPIQI